MSNTKLKRRDFVRDAAAAVGVIGLPCMVPSSALGKGAQVPPSERIGVAFVGPGGRGTGLLKEFTPRPEIELLAVCDVRDQKREKAKQAVEQLTAQHKAGANYRACRAYRDFRDVLARDDVHGVVVAAPEHWRPIMCIMAAKAGKDVLTEKPFALTIKQARGMVKAVRRYGCIFQHGTQRRSWASVRVPCELVRSGRIGKVTHAVVTVGPGPRFDFPAYKVSDNPPDPEVFDWDLWLGPVPWRPYPGFSGYWQRIGDFGLGSIGNWGSHTLDMVQWALGKDAQSPVEIIPPGAGQEHLALRYADGQVIYCPRTPGDSNDAAVFGTKGQKIIFGKPKIEDRYDPTPLGPGDVHLYDAHNDHNGNWLSCMRTRKPTICNEEVGFRSGMLCLLITIADRLKRPLKFDPDKLQFPGDDEANRLLDTPKRAPWRIC